VQEVVEEGLIGRVDGNDIDGSAIVGSVIVGSEIQCNLPGERIRIQWVKTEVFAAENFARHEERCALTQCQYKANQ
jgi:hypothetical protein